MTLHATITGYVQGIGFRRFARDAARQLGLRGYTRNQEDGSVYVLACGEESALRTLLERLRHGPRGAWVQHVFDVWSESEPPGLSSVFEVRH